MIIKKYTSELVSIGSCVLIGFVSLWLEYLYCSDLFSRAGALLIVVALLLAWYRENILQSKTSILLKSADTIKSQQNQLMIAMDKLSLADSINKRAADTNVNTKAKYKELVEKNISEDVLKNVEKKLDIAIAAESSNKTKTDASRQNLDKITRNVNVTEKAAAKLIEQQKKIGKRSHTLEIVLAIFGSIIWAYGSLMVNFGSCL